MANLSSYIGSSGTLATDTALGGDQFTTAPMFCRATIDPITKQVTYTATDIDTGSDIALSTDAINLNVGLAVGKLYASDIDNTGESFGTNTFAGNNSEKTIAHGLVSMPSLVIATPITNPGGYLGEIWVRKDATNIYVGNSGSFTGAFTWYARK